MAHSLEVLPRDSAAQPVVNLLERRRDWDGQAYTFLEFVAFYGATAGLAYWRLGGAEQPVDPTASSAESSDPQPGRCELIIFFIDYVPRSVLAQGRIAIVCRHWRYVNEKHAWRSMVLTIHPEVEDDGTESLRDDLNMSDAHATVKAFLSAPPHVQERAVRSTRSLTLKIAHLEVFLDYFQKWIELPFDRLERLVIQGPNHAEHARGLPLDGLDGIRLGFVLGKLSPTVETLILKVTFADEEDVYAHRIMTSILPSFRKLKVLDFPDCDIPCPYDNHDYKVADSLRLCHGLAVDIHRFRESWLANVPHLERLRLNLHDFHQQPAEYSVFNCVPLLKFLAEKCRKLHYLHIHFQGRARVECNAFAHLPTSVEWLMLSFEEAQFEEFELQPLSWDWHDTEAQDGHRASGIRKYLRPKVPRHCKLRILKDYEESIDVEDFAAACAHAAWV